MEGQKMGLIVVLLAMICAGATAQSSSCTNAIITLSPCLNYITGNSSTPSSSCCTQLASVVSSQPLCLCQVVNGGGSALGLNINQTLALNLPAACNVQTPSLSNCNAASPSGSPVGSPAGSPSSPGSKNVPTTGDGSSDGYSIRMSASILFLSLFAASYASIFN